MSKSAREWITAIFIVGIVFVIFIVGNISALHNVKDAIAIDNEINKLIKECEKSMPRDEHCEIKLVPYEVRNDNG